MRGSVQVQYGLEEHVNSIELNIYLVDVTCLVRVYEKGVFLVPKYPVWVNLFKLLCV